MNESVNPMDRLRSADPVTDSSYRHADQSAMLARIVAQPRVTKVHFAQGLRVRVASAAAAAALVSVAGIAALQSAGPSLVSLSLGSKTAPTSTSVNGAKVPGGSMMMRLAENFKFVAGPDLTSGAGNAPSYQLTAPTDLAATSQQIASHFGVTGDPSSTPALNSYWTIGDTSGSGAYVSFSTDGAVLTWSYFSAASNVVVSTPSSGDTTSSTPPATTDGLSDDAALAAANDQLSALGATGPFGSPTYSTSTNADGTSLTGVNIPWDAAGPGSYWVYSFTFDASGNMVYASGVDASVTTSTTYPLLSEVAGVDALQTQQSSYSNPGGPIMYSPNAAADGSAPTTSSSSGGGTASSPTTAPVGGSSTDPTAPPSTTSTFPTKTVVLDSATIQYSEYTLSDGSVVMLPQYLYAGDDGSQWSVLAVDPAYVQLSPTGSGKPIMY